MKKLKYIALLCVFGIMFSSCGNATKPDNSSSKPTDAEVSTPSSSSVAETPVSEQKPVILAVSFGTSYNESRDITIGAIEIGRASCRERV